MTVSALMEAMAAAGAPMEAIILAVRALEAKDAEIESRRAGDRERKRRQRAGTVTGQSRDTDVTVTDAGPAPSPSSSPDPSNNPTPTPGNETRARKGTRLPVDWQPEPLSLSDEQIVKAWPVGALERELSKYRDFWAAKAGAGGVKLDWQATWRNWLRSADERMPRHAQSGRNDRPSAGTSRSGYGRTVDAAERFLAAGGHH